MEHHVKVHADTHEQLKAAAAACGARKVMSFPFGGRVVGIIFIDALSQRQVLRKQDGIDVLPSQHSPADVGHHAKKMNLPNAKTARDIHVAVFGELDVDYFDPDL